MTKHMGAGDDTERHPWNTAGSNETECGIWPLPELMLSIVNDLEQVTCPRCVLRALKKEESNAGRTTDLPQGQGTRGAAV
jgi:hypothetical protein